MSRPNIIFFFTDQQRPDTLGCYGQKLNISPNLDRLAKEGIVFDEAYTAQPVCGPCRALFQTGRYPTETGCYRNAKALPAGAKTIAQYFEENGYETAYVGKWHLPVKESILKRLPLLTMKQKRYLWSTEADILVFGEPQIY